MKTRKRVFSFTFLVLFLWTLPADELLCFFCGPSPETSSTAKVVSHIEDDCPLQDGFEREDPTSETESIHIHFCTLHATFVEFTQIFLVEPLQISSLFQNHNRVFHSLVATSLYHPPRNLHI